MSSKIYEIYQKLYEKYGPQGWWPLLELHDQGTGNNPTKTGSVNGYHPKNHSYPKTAGQKWEIIMGALLTQNTNWPQVEKALINLKSKNIFSHNEIIAADIEDIKLAIKPVGYFNQKSMRLKSLAIWFEEIVKKERYIPSRNEVLSQKGVGPETADSILLYAFGMPEFVVDAYTKRIFSHLKIINKNDSYNEIKNYFQEQLSKLIENKDNLKIIYQEYHALIVEHAKRCYQKKPYAKDCFL